MNTDRNDAPAPSNFIRNIIEDDNRSGKWSQRVETRFPPDDIARSLELALPKLIADNGDRPFL